MSGLIGLVLSLLITDWLYFYCYDKILGRRYSFKVTAIFTMILWIYDCLAKPIPIYVFGVEPPEIMTIITFVTCAAYAVLLYKSSLWKRLLVMLVYILVTMVLDFVGLSMTSLIVGGYYLFEIESHYTAVGCVCYTILVLLGTMMFIWAWKSFEQRNFTFERYQWFGWLMPLSQYAVLQNHNSTELLKSYGVTSTTIAGLLLAVIGDIFLFHTMIRHNEKKRVEAELKDIRQQYELEKIRYEGLKELEEEVSKIRHELGNYAAVVKSRINESV